jgi:serine/threonine-protein kinase
MSPEQARGLRGVDHRTDLWSLGVILYRAVTGAAPFKGESASDIIVKLCTERPPLPSRLVPRLSSAVDDFFLRALTVAPAERFQSAAELVDAFARLVGKTRLELEQPGDLAGPLAGPGPESSASSTVVMEGGPTPPTEMGEAHGAPGVAAAASAAGTGTESTSTIPLGTLSNVSSSPAFREGPPRRSRVLVAAIGGVAIGGAALLGLVLVNRSHPDGEASRSAASVPTSAPASEAPSITPSPTASAVAIPTPVAAESAALPVSPSAKPAATAAAAKSLPAHTPVPTKKPVWGY